MSTQSAQQFLEMIKTDTELREQFMQLDTWEAKKRFAEKTGFSFSRHDLNAVSQEINDDDLSDIAGGGCGVYSKGPTCDKFGDCPSHCGDHQDYAGPSW